MLHKLAHLFGLNYGKVVTKVDSDGWLWVGFQCSTCSEIQDKYKTKTRLRYIMSEEKIELTEEYTNYLNDLRDGGSINMFAAGVYLERQFNLTKKEAKTVLFAWMKRN